MLRSSEADKGTVAIVAAMLAIVLFGVGALAVDLGNSFSRRRAVQTTADLAALAGGQSLPDTCAAWTKAVEYLRDNPVQDDDGADDFTGITDAMLRDGDLANGEVTVSDSAGGAVTACPGSTAGRRVRVVTPERNVAFGLASAMGFTDTEVNAAATAGVFSGGSMLPVFTPEPCRAGSQVVKEGSGSSVAPVFAPAGDNQGPRVDTVSPFEDRVGQTPLLTIELSGMSNPASSQTVDTMAVSFTRGAQNVPPAGDPPLRPSTYVAVGNRNGRITVTLPAAVSIVTGVWKVRVAQTVNSSLHFSPDQQAGQYQVTPASCGQVSTGDFGLLDSPRGDTNQMQLALDRNIASGVDHKLVEFPPAQLPPDNNVADNCRTQLGNAVIPGGVLDNEANRAAGNKANCLNINTGNKVDALTDGLVMGAGPGFPGRLTKAPIKSCPAPTGGTNPRTLLGRNIVNSMLTCYLRSGATLAQLNNSGAIAAAGSDGLLEPSIAGDPRFFVVPVIYAATNPQNGYYPIVEFRAAFITDETELSAATASNGLSASTSTRKITEMRAFLFDLAALPDVVQSGGNGIEFNGALKIVRLIE